VAWTGPRTTIPAHDLAALSAGSGDRGASRVCLQGSGVGESGPVVTDLRQDPGAGHWDAYATFDFEGELSSNVDIAISAGSDRKMSGSAALGKSTGRSLGYTSRGPCFAKQVKIPLQYLRG